MHKVTHNEKYISFVSYAGITQQVQRVKGLSPYSQPRGGPPGYQLGICSEDGVPPYGDDNTSL